MPRVLDLTPVCAAYGPRLLVEAGYDVIRIESPQGDALRRRGPFLPNVPVPEASADHQFLNAGKRSMTLDFTTAAGLEVLKTAVRTADVLIAALPLPVDREELAALNPELVIVGIEADDEEVLTIARTGLLAITGQPGERPAVPGAHVSYAIVGLHLALAVSAAMLARELSGGGRYITVSAAECLISMVEQAMVTYQSTGKSTERRGYRGAVTAVSGAFPCADGYWMLSVPPTPDGWRRFMEWMNDPVLADDETLTAESQRNARKELILDRIDQWSLRYTKQELVTEGQNRHIPSTPVSNPLELINDPQLVGRGFLRDIDHALLGRVRMPVGAIAAVKGRNIGRAPLLGEHSSELLQELGYSEQQRRVLAETGVV
jgi:crotonobetainyl-CoA:carnitine CoA-transferase CaiB-like acyl-CoA transferase